MGQQDNHCPLPLAQCPASLCPMVPDQHIRTSGMTTLLRFSDQGNSMSTNNAESKITGTPTNFTINLIAPHDPPQQQRTHQPDRPVGGSRFTGRKKLTMWVQWAPALEPAPPENRSGLCRVPQPEDPVPVHERDQGEGADRDWPRSWWIARLRVTD